MIIIFSRYDSNVHRSKSFMPKADFIPMCTAAKFHAKCRFWLMVMLSGAITDTCCELPRLMLVTNLLRNMLRLTSSNERVPPEKNSSRFTDISERYRLLNNWPLLST